MQLAFLVGSKLYWLVFFYPIGFTSKSQCFVVFRKNSFNDGREHVINTMSWFVEMFSSRLAGIISVDIASMILKSVIESSFSFSNIYPTNALCTADFVNYIFSGTGSWRIYVIGIICFVTFVSFCTPLYNSKIMNF